MSEKRPIPTDDARGIDAVTSAGGSASNGWALRPDILEALERASPGEDIRSRVARLDWLEPSSHGDGEWPTG